LCLWQWVCSLLLDGILGCHHKKGGGQFVRFVGDGDGFFLHRFQHGGLSFGRGTVDFISQNQVGKQWPLLEAERTTAVFILVHNIRAGNIGGHHVGRELDAAKLQIQHLT